MSKSSASASIYVALLRGVNVGGNNMVSMRGLKDAFERMRLHDVSTYINSGNVLFSTGKWDARELEDRIDIMLAREFGLKGRTVVRSDAEMAEVVGTMSRVWTGDPAWRYNVIFMRHPLDPRRALEGLEIHPDLERVVPCPGALLWSARIQGLTRTAMLKLASRPVYQQMTVRNANTTRKLFELMRGISFRCSSSHHSYRARGDLPR